MKFGRYRYWGDQKPDTTRPLLTLTRADAVVLKRPEAAGDPGGATDSPAAATLRIYGPIDSWGGWWGVSAKEVATALDILGDVERVVVRINSPGGDAFEGRAIMNLLRAHKAQVTGVVDGLAASAASYIVVGCDETVMAPGTELMIHDTHAIMYGDAAAFRKEAEVLESISKSGAELYADVAGGTVEKWRELQRAETWFTAAEAVAAGLADRTGVVPDAGPVETATEDDTSEVDPATEDKLRAVSFDLSIFQYEGRSKAPAPPVADIAGDPKPPTASAGGSVKTQEGEHLVAFTDEQLTQMRKDLGLKADADEATIVAALSEVASESETTPSSAAPQIPEGMALVDSNVLKDLQAGATAGRTAQKTLAEQERDRALNQALSDGKIAATSREKFADAWDKDPEGTRAILDALTPGLVPTSETGHGDQPEVTEDDELYALVYGDEKKGA